MKAKKKREKKNKFQPKIKTHNTAPADIILSFYNENGNGIEGGRERERDEEKKMLMAVIFQEVVY